MLRQPFALISVLLTVAICARIGSADPNASLVKVKTKDFKVYVGELKKEDNAGITVMDLSTGHDHIISKADVKSVDRDISDDDAVVATNLPTVLAWKILKMEQGSEKPLVGKVARITEDVVYVSLGQTSGVAVGDRLAIFRHEGDVKDPDTGKILGSERSRLAEVELVEVQAAYSKAKKVGKLEIKLQVGDEVETTTHPLAIAVFQPLDADGKPTDAGTALAEQLTTKMVANKIPVVERARLTAVLTELAIQNTNLFEPEKAQKVGHQIGATAVLTGKIVAGTGKLQEAQMRLIEVATGKVVLAASCPLRAGAAKSGDGEPLEPDKNTRKLEVESRVEWQTVMAVRRGTHVKIAATGRFCYDTRLKKYAGPDGADGTAYLEYRIGGGTAHKAGSNVSFVADADGDLELEIQDPYHNDNDGSLHVVVTIHE